MTMEATPVDATPLPRRRDTAWALQWTPIVVGALTATALSSILITFAGTIGLGVSSAAPTWRDASWALWLLSGIYLILQALIAFGCGGYVAGRTQDPLEIGNTEEVERRDGFHGIAAWALAVVLGVLLAALIGMAASRPSALATPPSATEPSVLSYEIDQLFRAGRRPANIDLTPARAEAGRILLTSSSHSGVTTEDRSYLIQMVSGATGLDWGGCGATRRQCHFGLEESDRQGARQHHHLSVLDRDRAPSGSGRGLGRGGSRRPASRRHAVAGLDDAIEWLRPAPGRRLAASRVAFAVTSLANPRSRGWSGRVFGPVPPLTRHVVLLRTRRGRRTISEKEQLNIRLKSARRCEDNRGTFPLRNCGPSDKNSGRFCLCCRHRTNCGCQTRPCP